MVQPQLLKHQRPPCGPLIWVHVVFCFLLAKMMIMLMILEKKLVKSNSVNVPSVSVVFY